MIDTHVHLQHLRYAADLAPVLDRAAAAGVTAVIVPGTTLDDSAAAIALVQEHADHPVKIYAAVGIHPTEADDWTPEAMVRLRKLATVEHVVAVGEIGLDYYWPSIADRGWACADPETQRRALQDQLALATDLDLPVVIHDRDAHRDTLDILKAWKASDPRARGTLHSYAAGPDFLDEAMALGFHIGIDGPVTFKKADDLREVAYRAPLDRILLETDGPYLTPTPYRGKRNEPAYLVHIARKIAEVRGASVTTIMSSTTRNAAALFNLSL
jgi:TatD DNase family protein